MPNEICIFFIWSLPSPKHVRSEPGMFFFTQQKEENFSLNNFSSLDFLPGVK